MLGMIKEAYKESGDRVVAPALEEICKNFGTIATPSIIITLKADFLFIDFLFLLYKFSEGNYEL